MSITTFENLCERVAEEKAQGKRLVLCHGAFDLLHIGHIRFLQQARQLGDCLIVTVTPDRYVDKGPGRPAFPEHLRLESVAALDCVNYAAINPWPTTEETLRRLLPQVYAKGKEFCDCEDLKETIDSEAAVCAEIGCELTFIEDIVFSSSNLINRYLSTLSKDAQDFLRTFRLRYGVEDVVAHIDAFAQLKVLVVGDAVVDKYIYCSSLGSSSKDPMLALQYQSQELFAGGALAVANHLAELTEHVTLVSVLGDDDYANVIQDHLHPSIRFLPVIRKGSPTVTKTRILDNYSLQKLLEIYTMESKPLVGDALETLHATVTPLLPHSDVVLAADFGHGCIPASLVEVLANQAPYLAVNTQANAANRGHHTISRYPSADFISLSSHEINLEYRNTFWSLNDMMLDLQKRLHCPTIVVTEGRNGCAVLQQEFVRAPSLTASVVDRVGAGDALFAITALAAHLHFPSDLLAFLGNIVGSIAVETIGNAKAVSRDGIQKYITSLLQ